MFWFTALKCSFVSSQTIWIYQAPWQNKVFRAFAIVLIVWSFTSIGNTFLSEVLSISTIKNPHHATATVMFSFSKFILVDFYDDNRTSNKRFFFSYAVGTKLSNVTIPSQLLRLVTVIVIIPQIGILWRYMYVIHRFLLIAISFQQRTFFLKIDLKTYRIFWDNALFFWKYIVSCWFWICSSGFRGRNSVFQDNNGIF